MAIKVFVKLGKDAVNVLMKPVNGQGGFQTLMRKLQGRVRGRQVWVTGDDIVRINKYVTGTGQGGFQGRLSPFMGIVKEITDTCVEMYAG